MYRKTVIPTLLIGCFCQLSTVLAAEPNDYIVPGRSYMLSGTLSGLRLAHKTFDNGIDDQNCADCRTNRELIFLHAATRSAMLFIDNNDVSIDSFLELAQKFGVEVIGDYFFDVNGFPDVNDIVHFSVLLDANGFYRVPVGAPNAVEVGEIIKHFIIPEINDTVNELDSIDDSPSNRFRIFFKPTETGLANDLEVDYGEVLVLKGLLLASKAQLEAKLAYDIFVDVNEVFLHKLLYEDGFDINDGNTVDLPILFDINDPNNPSINRDFLDRYPYLLRVLPTPGHEEDGAAILAQDRQDWIKAIDYYFNAIDYISSEDNPAGTDPQKDELLYIDPNDQLLLDMSNESLAVLRNSLENDTIATYPLETTKTYGVYNSDSVLIGELVLIYEFPNLGGKSGSLTLIDSNIIPSPWEVDWFDRQDVNQIDIDLEYFANGKYGWGFLEGVISNDSNYITLGTFEYWGATSGILSGLSAHAVSTKVTEVHLDSNPVFGSTARYPNPLNPRDLLPEFDDRNIPISGTFGHGLQNDPTLGGILPDMTQDEWAILFDLPVPGLRFYEELRLAVGSSPKSVAVGDLNHDGILDIVVANSGSNDISVLLGLSNGGFSIQTRFGVGQSPESLVIGDINGDGVLDIVTANSGSNDVSILLGQGDGSFSEQARFGVGFHPVSVVLGDLNSDGMLDIVTANQWSASVSVLLGTGSGSFASHTTFAVGSGPSSAAIGDLNGDGFLDIVTANSWSNTISILLGLGDGKFQARSPIMLGFGPCSVSLGDLNKDGTLDVVTASCWSEDVSVLLGLGNGDFGAQTLFEVGNQPQFLLLADVNGDGVLDVVTANTQDGDISVLLGVGDGSLGRSSRFEVEDGPRSLAITDLNGDSIADIVVANTWTNDLAVLFNRSVTFGHSPSGKTVAPVEAIRIHFPHDMDSSSFSDVGDVVSFTGPVGTINIQGYEWLNSRTLEIRFEPQFLCGIYELVIGPGILDLLGQAMDVDGDKMPGEIPDDRYIATFQITAPRILGHTPRGTVAGPISSIYVRFDSDMDLSTFSPVDDIISFTGPQGLLAPPGYVWLSGRMLELTFDAQPVPGSYQMVIGPQILDLAGNALNLDGDSVAGEMPDDQYVATFNIPAPPRIVGHAPSGAIIVSVSSLQLNFDRDMDPDSFSMDVDIMSFTGPAGPVVLTDYAWLGGKTLELTFEALSTPGTYKLVIGPQIRSIEGVALDQDADFVAGEMLDDEYTATFEIVALPRIIAHKPSGVTEEPVDYVRFSFSHPMDQNSFSLIDDVVSFVGPQGAITPAEFSWLDEQTLEVTFDSLLLSGLYQMIIGPRIVDLRGYALDIDGDHVTGEEPDDQYIAKFFIPVELPRTGQTTSYTEGDDGDLKAGVAWPDPRFIDNLDGTVTDCLTGLMWTKNANILGTSQSWYAALDYVSKMNAGEHENFGHTDWRMPNIVEIESLINAEANNPAGWLNSQVFTNVPEDSYWSHLYWSSSGGGSYTKVIWFYGGHILGTYKMYSGLLWPVRTAQLGVVELPKTGITWSQATGDDGDLQIGVEWPEPRFTDNEDGTVTDNLTLLMWTKDADVNGAMTWYEALDFVASLNDQQYLGFSDWRLPNRMELRSIVDHSRGSPALAAGHPFVNVRGWWGQGYWTSTTCGYDTSSAMGVWLMWSGEVTAFEKDSQCYVWPVRGVGVVGKPGVISHRPSGEVKEPVGHIAFQFNQMMDLLSFTIEDDVVSFLGPDGPIQTTGFSWVWVDDATLEILFDPQGRTGTYEMVIGPLILNNDGKAMDQDNDANAGEIPDDQYIASFTITPPKLTGHTSSGSLPGSLNWVRFQFDRAMDPNSFSLDDIASFTGPDGPVTVTDFRWIDSKTLEVMFEPQSCAGTYKLIIGPQVSDTTGNNIDEYTATFIVTAPKLVSSYPVGKAVPPVSSAIFNFNREMDTASFLPNDDIMKFTGPHGPLVVTGYRWVDSDTLEVTFESQFVAGKYEIVIGPQILDYAGNALDQDNDLRPGEVPEDLYSATFLIEAPRVVQHTPSGKVVPPISSISFDFDHVMDKASFSLSDDIVSFVGPSGNVSPTNYTWVDADTLEVMFEPQWAMGGYQMVVGPQILDIYGNAMDQDNDLVTGEVPADRYTATFTLAYSGTLVQDATWGPERGVIVVDGPLTVANGVMLTIEAGTVIKFLGGNSGIIVNGVLNIEGTPQERVILTSFKDDTAGGDTNGDGDATSPAPGNWGGLRFSSSATVSTLENVQIRYANIAIQPGASYAHANLRRSILSNNRTAIYGWTGYAHIEMDNCLITNNDTVVYIGGTFGMTFRNCTISGNASLGTVGYPILNIANSIVAFNTSGFYGWPRREDLEIRNSLFFSPAEPMVSWVGEQIFRVNGNLTLDPLFVDKQAGSYELSAGSPAIDAARGVGAPPNDILGCPRYDDLGMPNLGSGFPSYVDMGAFERQQDTAAGDLAVTYVSAPTPEFLGAGEPFSVEWMVANVGLLDCNGTWQDAVYLSTDPYLSADDRVLEKRTHTGTLNVGATYTESLTSLAPTTGGIYYILVRTNADANLAEAVQKNNVMASSNVLAVDLPALTLSQPVSGTVRSGQWSYVRFDATQGNTIILSLDSATSY